MVATATQTFKDKINDLTNLYGKTLEELKEINKIVLKHEIKLETHDFEIESLKNTV